MSARGTPFFLALVAVTLTGPLSVHLFLPALPQVRLAFAVEEGAAQLSFSAAMLAMAVATLCYGSLSDRFGRLPILVVGMAAFSGGAAIGAAAPSIEVLIVGRILQGAGAASGMVMARTIVRDVYGTARLGQMLAYLTTAYVVGPMIAPPLGGVLIDALGWQSILIVPAVFGGLGLLISIVVIGETRPGVDAPDVPLLHAYLRLLGRPRFVCFAFNPGFGSAAFFSLNVGAAYLFVAEMGRGATEYGLYFILGPAGFMLGNFLAGRLAGRVSGNALIVAGAIVSLAGALCLPALIALGGLMPLSLFLPILVLAVGQGLGMPHAQAAAINTDPQLAGTATGMIVFGQYAFIAAATQVVAMTADGTTVPMTVCGLAAAVAAAATGLAGVVLSRRR